MDKVYKRQYREQTPETKQKISAALKNKPKNDSHKKAISQGLKDYWKKIPSTGDTNFTTSGRVV